MFFFFDKDESIFENIKHIKGYITFTVVILKFIHIKLVSHFYFSFSLIYEFVPNLVIYLYFDSFFSAVFGFNLNFAYFVITA